MALNIVILGIIEGLTEFIPVSSTAHLLITSKILGIPSGQFVEALSICIQSGAILAVVWYFSRLLLKERSLITKVFIAFIPTAIAGILLYPIIKSFLDKPIIIALALIAGGIGLIHIRPIEETASVTTISYRQAFLIGLTQIASFIPGISRAGATLIGGTLLKIPRNLIVSFSFLLAIPTILGAGFVEARHVSGLTNSQWWLIALGTVVSFITALITIKFFMNILTTKPLRWWGWYRIGIGILILILL